MKNLRRNRIWVKYLLKLFNFDGWRMRANLYWRNTASTTLTKQSGARSSVVRHWYHELHDTMFWEGYVIFVVLLTKTHNHNPIMWKHKINPNWGIWSKITDKYFSKVSRPWRRRKNWGPITDCRRLRRKKKQIQCGIMGQKRTSVEKLVRFH